MIWPKIHISRGLRIVLAGLLVFLSIGFSGARLDHDTCRRMLININNQYQNHFLNEQDIMAILNSQSGTPVIGTSLSRMPLKTLEQRLKSESFISNAQLFADLKGSLTVEVDLRKPIARIVRSGLPDNYIAEDGTILPISDKYVSRVILVSGSYDLPPQNLTDKEGGEEILELIRFINGHKFWKAQVAQLDINKQGEIILYPQVTKQRVEFGKAKDIERKFNKLEIFYKRILPEKGWNTYERVNLQFEGQIIAE